MLTGVVEPQCGGAQRVHRKDRSAARWMSFDSAIGCGFAGASSWCAACRPGRSCPGASSSRTPPPVNASRSGSMTWRTRRLAPKKTRSAAPGCRARRPDPGQGRGTAEDLAVDDAASAPDTHLRSLRAALSRANGLRGLAVGLAALPVSGALIRLGAAPSTEKPLRPLSARAGQDAPGAAPPLAYERRRPLTRRPMRRSSFPTARNGAEIILRIIGLVLG
jgi:hypothetical protein